MKTVAPLLFVLLAAVAPVSGISLRVLPWDDKVAEREFTIAHGKKSVEVGYLHPSARSQPLSIPGDAADLRLEATDRKDAEGKPLVFRWEKQARAMPPGWKPVTAAPGGKSRNMEVFLYRKDDLKNPIYTAVWEHRTDMRHLVFVVPSKNAALGPYDFKFIPETLLSEEGE